MPQIAIVLPSLEGGGAERAMVNLANGLAESHEVDLVLARKIGPYREEVSPKVNVLELGTFTMRRSLIRLILYLRKAQPEAVLACLPHVNVVVSMAALLSRRRHLFRLVLSERSSTNLVSESPRGRIVRAAMKYFYPRSDAIITVSPGIAKQVIEEFGVSDERVVVIPNSVDLPTIDRLSGLELVPHIGQVDPYILAVGRLAREKDYPTLIRAFAAIQRETDVNLVILGEGALRSELETLSLSLVPQGRVRFLGFVKNPYNWMKRCELCVLASRYEGFPNALVQAMACGAPVVATDCETGPREILEDGKWGALVGVGDVQGLAQAMLTTLRSPQSRDPRVRAVQFRSDAVVGAYAAVLVPW